MTERQFDESGPEDLDERSAGDGYPEAEFRQAVSQVKESVMNAGAQIKEEARQRAQSLFADQKRRAVSELESIADALRQSGRRLKEQEQEGMAHYADRFADRVERISEVVRDKDIGHLVGEVETFARRQPALFLVGAFAAGFFVARLIKSTTGESPLESRAERAKEYDEEVFVGEGMPYTS